MELDISQSRGDTTNLWCFSSGCFGDFIFITGSKQFDCTVPTVFLFLMLRVNGFLGSVGYSFHQIWKNLSIISSNIFSVSPTFHQGLQYSSYMCIGSLEGF